jgi:hypothetical protein
MVRLGREQLESVGREPPKRTTPVAWVLPTMNPEAQAL